MNVLIAGVGYIGEALADELTALGHRVIGITHSEDSRARLSSAKPYRVYQADIAQRDSVYGLADFEVNGVAHCASSGRGGPEDYRAVYYQGAVNLMDRYPRARFVFTSSTSVLAQTTGEWVDESSPAEPDRETGKILRETELAVLARGGVVARVAGIYGPGRSVLLRKFLAGEAVLEGDGQRYVNQAHRDDVVAALVRLLAAEDGALSPPRLFHVADDEPQTQRDLYAWMAERFQRPMPPAAAPDLQRKRGWTSKRVSNAKLRALGWAPSFPRFQDAVGGESILTRQQAFQ